MTNPELDPGPALARARAGDADAFATLVDGHRVGLLRHCYRMLGSGLDAEEALQDTLLRAWQRLDTYEARGSFQGWIYRIATNLCIDRLRGRRPRSLPMDRGPASPPGAPPSAAESPLDWVEPIGDQDLGLGEDPAHSAELRERISLAFVAALQRLSARQRAALLLHDVLDFSHEEVAEVLDSSPSAVNSLLFRARETMSAAHAPVPANPADPAVKELLDRYIRAWERADVSELVATVSADVRLSMPPIPTWYRGLESVVTFIESAVFAPARPHGVTMQLGGANGQPALATYQPRPDGTLVVNGLQILEIDAGSKLITAITSYRDPAMAVRCGLPAVLT